ncbi:MAG TPA: four helix bundle protein, partial [Candidatus Latescibacteria bacterium]|nr:four helix bundle protein [Candidatus Latescibacterota bacterium]
IGRQIVRSIDRFGANIAEGADGGTGRSFHYYMQISIGSIYETKHWLRQAENRNLL